MVEHVDISDDDIHQPKGAATATDGEAMFSSGAGATEFREIVIDDISDFDSRVPAPGTVIQGAYKYADTATQTTPIDLVTPGQEYDLTNDGLGAETFTTWALPGLPNIWDTTNNKLDFVGTNVLSLGDNLDILVEISITTPSTNTEVSMFLDLDAGGTPFRLNILEPTNFKSVGTYGIDRFISFFMKSNAILNGDGKIRITSDSANTTVKVNGFFVRVFHTQA
jgi:hypothetical protein